MDLENSTPKYLRVKSVMIRDLKVVANNPNNDGIFTTIRLLLSLGCLKVSSDA